MNGTNFTLFLLAALIIAAVPGPGIFYVAARTLSGGQRAGIASTLGTALGGLGARRWAARVGVSAIILDERRAVHRAEIRRRALSGLSSSFQARSARQAA